MRTSRVTRRDTRQERAHSVEQHRNAFSSGHSLVQMNTVADGLASLSFHQAERKKRKKKEREGDSENRKVKGRRQFSMWASKHVQSAVINTSVINQQCRENKARVSLRECPFIAEYE